jgi:hypothetical protein
VILTLAVLILRVVSLPDYRGLVDPVFVTFGLVETGALVAVGVPLFVLAARALRRLPANPGRRGLVDVFGSATRDHRPPSPRDR